MIIKKYWHYKEPDGRRYICHGYFLLGFIPLYIDKYSPDIPNHLTEKK